MAEIYKRLEKIKYQTLKERLPFTDEQAVQAVLSIYDAAIDDDTILPSEAQFPNQVLGVDITWSLNKKIVNLVRNNIVVEDDLTDDSIPDIDANYLLVNGELFQFADGDNLLLV